MHVHDTQITNDKKILTYKLTLLGSGDKYNFY